FSRLPAARRAPLFPYTTLFRSRNGPRGDLVAVLEIAEDPRFERHGDDLVFDLPVSFSQAALGAEVEVPTPYGPTTLRIQKGTQTDRKSTRLNSSHVSISYAVFC